MLLDKFTDILTSDQTFIQLTESGKLYFYVNKNNKEPIFTLRYEVLGSIEREIYFTLQDEKTMQYERFRSVYDPELCTEFMCLFFIAGLKKEMLRLQSLEFELSVIADRLTNKISLKILKQSVKGTYTTFMRALNNYFK